jgi:hypothetical protein
MGVRPAGRTPKKPSLDQVMGEVLSIPSALDEADGLTPV